MKRFISIIVILLYCRMVVFSIEVNKEYATQIGVSFLQQKAQENSTPVAQSLSSDAECLTDTAFPHLYILNTENGWAIMPNDTRVQPILAYSVNGSYFDIDNVSAPIRCLLRDYEEQIRFIQDSLPFTNENADWEQIATQSSGDTPSVILHHLAEVAWAQSYNHDDGCTPSYNQLCPTFYTPRCGRTRVGCTAVAMGQV